jgi:hypothetical protein
MHNIMYVQYKVFRNEDFWNSDSDSEAGDEDETRDGLLIIPFFTFALILNALRSCLEIGMSMFIFMKI